jgi:DNA-binding MarR family transcriptional regulator
MSKELLTEQKIFELWAALIQAHDTMLRARQNELKGKNITMMQASVLFIAKSIDAPPTPAEISRWIFREPHTVSVLITQMEKQGLVRKVKDLDRKNLVRIEITEKGEEAYRRSREDATVIGEIFSCLSLAEADQLQAYLERLRDDALKKFGGRKLSLPYPREIE